MAAAIVSLCRVGNCGHLSTSSIDDGGDRFYVCELHDHPRVRAMLEGGECPGAFWSADGFPIIVPIGPFEPKHLEPLKPGDYVTRACDCPLLANVGGGRSGLAATRFDLSAPVTS